MVQGLGLGLALIALRKLHMPRNLLLSLLTAVIQCLHGI